MEKGISRTHKMSFLRSFRATAAPLVMSVSAKPCFIFAKVFKEQGAMMVAFMPNEPLATLAAENSQLATPNFQNPQSDFSDKNSHAKKQKSEFEVQNLNANDEFIALCKEKFELKKTQFLDDENLNFQPATLRFFHKN